MALKDNHGLEVGDTGSGKTTGMRQHHAESVTASIWVNHNEVHNVAGVAVNTDDIDTAEELRFKILESLDRFDSFRNVTLNVGKSSDWGIDKLTEGCYMAARDIFDTAHKQLNYPVQLCIDEIHNYWDDTEEGDPELVRHMFKEGRGEGIQLRGTTQDPADLPNVALKQVRLWAWYGPPAGTHQSFFHNAKWSWMPTDKFPTSNHMYIVYDKHGVIYAPEGKDGLLWSTKQQYGGRFT